MSMESVSAFDLHKLGKKYFGDKLLVVEIWSEGVRFVWIEKGQPDDESSIFLNIDLAELSIEKVVGFLDATTQKLGM